MADYTIDPEDLVKQRIADRLAIQQGLPQQGADLEQRFPMTQAMPNATAETQGIASPQQINYTMDQLQQRFPTVEGGPGMQVPPEPSIGEQVASNPELAFTKMGVPPEMAKELARHINNSGPPELWGKDIFKTGQGGILGTGVTPLSALAHIFGAAITSRLPQDQAIAATLKIGGLPSEIRAAQQKASAQVIDQLISGGNTGVAYQNSQQNMARTGMLQEETNLRQSFRKSVEDAMARGETKMSQQQKLLGVAAKMLPVSALNQETALVKTVMQDAETGQLKPVQIVVDKATHQPILDENGKPTAFPMVETTGGAKDIGQATREILAADKQAGGNMTIAQAHEQAKNEAMATFGQRAQTTSEFRPARAGTYGVGGKVVETPYENKDAQALLKQQGSFFYPQGSDKEKFYKAGNIVTSHIDEGLGLMIPVFEKMSGGDNNRLIQFGKMKLSQFQNNPEVVAMLDALGPASAFAASAPYIAASGGMRGGPKVAEMFQKSFMAPSDSVLSFLKKQETFARLSIKGLQTEGVDTTEAQKQLAQINLLQARFGGAGTESRFMPGGGAGARQEIGKSLTPTHRYNPATGKVEEIK